ncbi:MAG: hypothetical protein RR063_11815, partial [Anaerovoracaceae bacterium]
ELEFLKDLASFSLESKMLICQRYASRIMGSSEVDMKKAYEQDIMPWELEAFAAFSVIYDEEGIVTPIDAESFSTIITNIRNYWHPELTLAEENGTYADVFMMISALQQFPVQGIFLQKLFRYDYFFNFTNSTLDMNTEFIKTFKTSYINFEIFAFIIFISCSLESQASIGVSECQCSLSKALGITTVFKQLYIEKDKYKKQLMEFYRGNVVDYYYGLKLQYLYPLISGTDFIYIPSPYLVVNAVTESLLNKLTLGNKQLRNSFGKEVIENYLFDIYKDIPDVTWISHEFSYGNPEVLTPDVLVSEGDYCTFFDTKALSPSLKVRQFNQKEIIKELNIYAENALQVYRQILNYTDGCFELDKKHDKEKMFGVVVVLEDAVLPRKRVYERAFDLWSEKNEVLSEAERTYIRSHIKVVPLKQIESMVLQNMSFLPCLITQERNPEQWDALNFCNPNIEHGLIPIYAQYVDRIKESVSTFLQTK